MISFFAGYTAGAASAVVARFFTARLADLKAWFAR
jgi:hypothetical protein